MVALSLAILDRNNRPLYLQEFGFLDSSNGGEPSEEELMGLDIPVISTTTTTTRTTTTKSLWECSTNLQFVMHAASDRIDQILSTSSTDKPVDGLFLGLLTLVNEMRIYGHVTNTRTKIILVVEDEAVPEIQKNVDEGIKLLLAKVHSLYVAEVMNPFKEIGSPLVSRKFRDEIKRSIASFNQTGGI